MTENQKKTTHPQKILANNIADRIAGWIHNKRIIEARGRPVKAGDILILVRKRDKLISYISEALKKKGVAVAGLDRMNLLDNIAIQDLLALGQFLLLPNDDLNLATLLKSPLYRITEDELFKLCHNRGGNSLWQRLEQEKNLSPRTQNAYHKLRQLLAKADYISPYQLYSELLYSDKAISCFINSMGEYIKDIINIFLTEIASYEAQYTASLQGFLEWIEQGNCEIKRDMEQIADEVRIMTIHGAKGLQAPIVILPDTTSTPQYGSKIVYTKNNNIPLLSYNANHKPDAYIALCNEEKQTQQEEYNRLLYVALTRAEDELYIFGAKKKRRNISGSWYETINNVIEEKKDEREHISLNYVNISYEDTTETKPSAELPEYLRTAQINISEPMPPRPLRPSTLSKAQELPAGSLLERMDSTAKSQKRTHAIEKGNIIHRLLQILPNIAKHEQEKIAYKYVEQIVGETYSKRDKNLIVEETLSVLNKKELQNIFYDDNSLAELPIVGMVEQGKQVISGQIDRIHIGKKEITIVDFKTGKSYDKEKTPIAYIRQMNAYRHLLEEIYPNRNIKCLIIYTTDCNIVEI